MALNKLNFGSSFDIHEGWANLDKEDQGQEYVADILDGLPFPDNHFDIIVTNHVLHMFTTDELTHKVLPELRRVLREDGCLRIIDVDPLAAFWAHERKDMKALIIPDEVEKTIDGKLSLYLTWYGTRRSLATAEYMRTLLYRAGFFDCIKVGYKKSNAVSHYADEIVELDSRPRESYFVEAVK